MVTRQNFIDWVTQMKPKTSTQLAALLAAAESLAGSGAASAAITTTKLTAAAGSFVVTLPDGLVDKQEKVFLFVNPASTAEYVAVLTNVAGFTGFRMNAASNSLLLQWEAVTAKWVMTGGNCLMT